MDNKRERERNTHQTNSRNRKYNTKESKRLQAIQRHRRDTQIKAGRPKKELIEEEIEAIKDI